MNIHTSVFSDIRNNGFHKKLVIENTIYKYFPLQLSTLFVPLVSEEELNTCNTGQRLFPSRHSIPMSIAGNITQIAVVREVDSAIYHVVIFLTAAGRRKKQ